MSIEANPGILTQATLQNPELIGYLEEHKATVARVLGPIVLPGRPDIREAGLDFLLAGVFNPRKKGRYIPESRTDEVTEKLLKNLAEISTTCTMVNFLRLNSDVSRTSWPKLIITPREFNLLYQVYALDGQQRDLNSVISTDKSIMSLELESSRLRKLVQVLSDVNLKLFQNPYSNNLLASYLEFQEGRPMFPRSRMPGTFVAERLGRRF